MSTICKVLAMLTALALLAGCMQQGVGSGSGSGDVLSPSESVGHTTPTVHETVRLPWFNADNLNPYSCDTLQNYYLAGLLCDPLVALDSSNQPANRLALEIASSDYIQYAITLRSDAYFADGSPLTAADVLYSLSLAQASPRFAGGLGGISSAVSGGDHSLTITLSAADRYFPRSLIFPVLKEESGDSDTPMGVGRFLLEQSSARMVRNDRYYNPVNNVRKITLVATSSLEEQSYSVMEGTIDLMYSDLQSDLNLGLGIGYRQIPLSNLVYLRINHDKAWASKAMRQVLSGLAHREELVRRVYTGFAAVTSIPINPVMASTALTAADLESQADKQRELLEGEGWALQEDDTRQRNGITLNLELIATKENSERLAAAELLAENMRQVGIGVTVVPLPYSEYVARVSAGMYDLCIAETRIAYNMEISSLILPTTGFEPPVQLFPTLGKLYKDVKAGETEQIELETALRQELPVIPLLFRRGIICFSRDFSANMVATEQDIFYNIVEW